MEEQNTEKLNSRREILKKVGKTAAFVVPTIVTFEVSKLAVAASTQIERAHLGDRYRERGAARP